MAIKNLQKATQLKPEAFGTWGVIGLCYDQLKEYDHSVKAFREAIRLKPDSAESWDSLARVHAEMKDYDQAVAAAEEAIRLDPDDVVAWLVLGGAHAALHNFDEAARVLEEAVRLKPDYAAAWYNLGNVYGSIGKYDSAVAAHQEAVRLEPNEPTFLYNLGHSYALQGNRSKVLEVYEKLSALNPALANQFFTANVPQSPGTATFHYGRRASRQMMREAKTPEQYQTLASYFRSQERLYREKAQSEREEYERCMSSFCGSPKFPTRADVALQLHGYYVSEANRIAKLAEQCEKQVPRSASNAEVSSQIHLGGQPVRESSYENSLLSPSEPMMLSRIEKLVTQMKALLEQHGSGLPTRP
jgi:tetratricopeptide (TPR) repeat protein